MKSHGPKVNVRRSTVGIDLMLIRVSLGGKDLQTRPEHIGIVVLGHVCGWVGCVFSHSNTNKTDPLLVTECCKVSVSAVHVGANVGGAGRRLEGGSRSRSASPRLSGGRRGAKQLVDLSGGAAKRRVSARAPRRWCRWLGVGGRRRGTPWD